MNENTMPLKWHKFLIYFYLWISAFWGFYNALFFAGGLHYTNPRTGFPDFSVRDRLYDLFPSIKWIDLSYSIMLIALSVYIIYTRFQLARFRKGAPIKLLTLYILGFTTDLIYAISFFVIFKEAGISLIDIGNTDAIFRTLISSGISSAIMLLLNKAYYDKRKELFVN